MRPRFLLLLLPAALFTAACGGRAAETPDGGPATGPEPSIVVRFVEPVDGDTLDTSFPVRMQVEGVSLAPAGTMEEGTGHLHILVDTEFIAPGIVIPMDAQHRHFGDASSETELTLEPGEHVLRLQLADGAHVALEGDRYRDEIRVIVR